MDRSQKKCLIASASLHGFLCLLLVFSSAFFVAKEKPTTFSKLQFVPSRFVEDAMAGGGGNPNIARTDDVQKGSPDAPKQLINPPAQATRQQQPTPPPPAPDPEPVKPEPKRAEKRTPEPAATKPKTTPKPTEPAKPKISDKPAPTKPRIDINADLKQVTRTADDKRKQQEEAEAREAQRQHNAAVAAANAARQQMARRFNQAAGDLQRGFATGTKVDVGGPGGAAYASYGAVVQQYYQDAWKSQTRLFNDLNDDDFTATVEVVISREGRIIKARITDRSPNNVMNRCVQRALDSVSKLPPFPAFITDSERAFTIEFNLKTNRTTG
jgi:TonB family protein